MSELFTAVLVTMWLDVMGEYHVAWRCYPEGSGHDNYIVVAGRKMEVAVAVDHPAIPGEIPATIL